MNGLRRIRKAKSPARFNRRFPAGPFPRNAFTLLELMIAMGILAMVMAAIYSSWMAILRGTKAGLDAAADAQRVRVAMRVIEDSLVSARMFTANAALYSFEADTSEENAAALSFVARLAQSFPRSGRFGDLVVRRITFTVEAGPDADNRLVLRQTPLLMDTDIDEQEYPLVLARNVKLFKIEFWDTREEDWVDEWTFTNQLPRMVKVTLGLGQGEAFSSEPRELMTRVVGLPAVAVQQDSQQGRPRTPSVRP